LQAIKAVVTAMKDSNRDVRLAAVNSIRGMAKSGDQMAISAVGGRLEDQDQKVRDAASKVLPQLSNEFDERLVHEAIQRLTSMHAVVRKTAVETLVTVNTKGAPIVIDGLLKVMNDFDVNVKTFAIKELAKQAGRGHPDATAVVADQLDDTRPRVREAAAAALGEMATKTERHALSKLIGVLHDPALDLYGRMGIRAAALKSIRDISLADRGEDLSPRTLNSVGTAVRKLLKSPDWCVRKEAITTFVKASLSADRREILEILLEMLEDPKFEVRSECIQTLETYKNGMDKWVISGIVCRLVTPSGEVRHTASTILSKLLDKDLDEANLVFLGQITQGKIPSHGEIFGLLSKIVTRGDEEYLDGFLGCTRHTITPIRRLASDAVKSICIPGQSCVIEALIKNLKHDSSGVKCDSIKTLSQVVLKNDDRAVQIVQDMLNDPDFEVKKMVSDALMKMLAEGDSRRTVALACISLDSGYHSESDRKEALDALGQLAYASSKFKLEGWSIEDADLERFWQQIRIPRGGSNENPSGLFVPRILKSLEDESGWVRRAAVEAIMHCAKKGDQNVIQAVCRLLNDSSFAIRIAAVNSLAVST
jgi:HEAT repeat protein